jgi:hypothetical protein
MIQQNPGDVKKNPLGGPRGKGGYYEKLMEVIVGFRKMAFVN